MKTIFDVIETGTAAELQELLARGADSGQLIEQALLDAGV